MSRRRNPVDAGREPDLPPEAPVLDLAHLREFTGGDAQLEGELGALYLSTADLYLEEMARALAPGGGNWSKAAHALKGASANFGARRVAELAAAAEAAAAPPDADTIAALRRAIDQVRALFERPPG